MINDLSTDIQFSIKVLTYLNFKKVLSKSDLDTYYKHEANLINSNINYSDYIEEIGELYKEEIKNEFN